MSELGKPFQKKSDQETNTKPMSKSRWREKKPLERNVNLILTN